MTGELEAALMGLLNGGRQFITRNVHVCLERGGALLGPEVHHAPGIVGVFELMHLPENRSRALQIRRAGIHVRSGHLSGIDPALYLEISEAFNVTGCPQCGDAGRQVKPGCGVGNLGDEKARLQDLAIVITIEKGGVVKMIMHAHQSGDYRVAVKVKNLGIARSLRRSCWADRLYLSSGNNDGLIVLRRRAGAVNQFHMGKCDGRCVHRNVFLHFRREGGLCKTTSSKNGAEQSMFHPSPQEGK